MLCWRMFINDLHYKSDETVHVVVPDKHYKQPKLNIQQYAEMEFES